jgi:hypothetical protein
MSLHSDPAEMTPQQRRREIAGLLARGVRRLRELSLPKSPSDAIVCTAPRGGWTLAGGNNAGRA